MGRFLPQSLASMKDAEKILDCFCGGKFAHNPCCWMHIIKRRNTAGELLSLWNNKDMRRDGILLEGRVLLCVYGCFCMVF